MTRFFSTALVVALAAAPIFAQAPAGWQVRADRSTSATDPDGAGDIKFTAIPGGFRANNPTAAIYWNPANTAKGNYTLRGTFKLLEPSGHVNFYGLFVGGRALEGMEQNYLYFTVAQDGSFLVRKRAGDRMPDPNAPSSCTMTAVFAAPFAAVLIFCKASSAKPVILPNPGAKRNVFGRPRVTI